MKSALVLGAGGFIGSHLVKSLSDEGFFVRGVDLKLPEFWETYADDFIVGDLRDPSICERSFDRKFDEVYQLAADMGGAGYLFTGENDADVMHNSALINLNILRAAHNRNCKKIFYSSSACVYPEENQLDPNNPICSEDSVYPANPDSEYGWEKLFSERMYLNFNKNYLFQNKVARYHNIFGPYGTWDGGKEKAPAAICRKIASVKSGGEIEVWGNGEQTRSFLFIDECVEGTKRVMRSDSGIPLNIGSTEMVTINQLVDIISKIAGKKISINHIDGPLGVNGRNSDNSLIKKTIDWEPKMPLVQGLEVTYGWIEAQVQGKKN